MSVTPATFNTPHFRWKDPFVTIRITDSQSPQLPPAPTEKSQILLPGDPQWHEKDLMWRMKLGQLIVDDYLAINPGGYKGNKKYFLSRFPANYVLYVRKRTKGATSTNSKYDCYLLGGGHTFRSPNEFVFHAAWLMAGAMPGQCCCVYCDPSNPGQKGRSRSIEENRRLVRERIRRFKLAGVKINRGVNAMNRKGFLKKGTTKCEKRVSFEVDEDEDGLDEETPADSTSSVSSDRVVRLVHGYDEESEQDI